MKVILGIDIAKDKFDCCLLQNGSRLAAQFTNQPTGFRELLKWLKKAGATLTDLRAGLEATGPYWQDLAHFLFAKKIGVAVLNPARVKFFGQSQLARNKTDRGDASLIAEFCRVHDETIIPWQPLSAQRLQFRSLTRLLEARKNDLARERCRAATGDEFARADAQTMARLLQERVRKIQARIDALLKQAPELAEQRRLLCTIPAIGKVTAQIVLAELPPDLPTARQAAAYAGLTPRQDDSGTRQGRARLCKVGNARLRKALYLPAVSGRKSNDRLQTLAARLTARGLCKMQIIGACMHLLMRLCFGVLTGAQPYQREFRGQKAAA